MEVLFFTGFGFSVEILVVILLTTPYYWFCYFYYYGCLFFIVGKWVVGTFLVSRLSLLPRSFVRVWYVAMWVRL